MIIERATAEFDEPLPLESGGLLKRFSLAYESYGVLDSSRGNAILICHTGTSNAHAAGPPTREDPFPGWWDSTIGPGKPFDTDKYYVLCSNIIGGCGGSTGPSSPDPETGRPYGMRFPIVTIDDMVRAQVRLADRLGIEKFRVIAGGSTGGEQVLQWMASHPTRLDAALVITSTPRTTAHNLGLWEVIRRAIMLDPNWNGGDYYGKEPPRAGLALGSMIGMMTWMSRDVMKQRFGLRLVEGTQPRYTHQPEFAIQAFVSGLGRNAGERLDANTAIYVSKAIDYFDLSRGHADLSEAFRGLKARTLLVSYRSDWRYPPEEMDEIRLALEKVGVPVEHLTLESNFGHGAFIYDAEGVGRLIRRFLAGPA